MRRWWEGEEGKWGGGGEGTCLPPGPRVRVYCSAASSQYRFSLHLDFSGRCRLSLTARISLAKAKERHKGSEG